MLARNRPNGYTIAMLVFGVQEYICEKVEWSCQMQSLV